MTFCTLNQVNFNNFPGDKFTFERLADYLSAGDDPNGFVDDSPVLQLYSRDARCVENLLLAGANPHAKNADNENALHSYIKKELSSMKYILYWFSRNDPNGYSDANMEHIVELLLKAGSEADVELLNMSLARRCYNVFHLLLSYGAKPDVGTLRVAIDKADHNMLTFIVKDLSIEEMEKCLKDLCTISNQDFISTYIEPIIQKKKLDSTVQSSKSSITKKL